MKIAVVGTGYVGLVLARASPRTATTSSASTRTRQVRTLQRGKMPIYEPGLEELVRRNQRREAPDLHDRPRSRRARSAQIVFIAVGTPQGEDGSADLQHVLDVARDDRPRDERLQGHRRQEHGAGRHRREGPRGRSRRETTQPFSVVSNPEFLKQGAAIEDFMKPDRVVIGAEDDARGARSCRSCTRRSRAPARRS